MAILPTKPSPGKPSMRIGLFASMGLSSLMYVAFTLKLAPARLSCGLIGTLGIYHLGRISADVEF